MVRLNRCVITAALCGFFSTPAFFAGEAINSADFLNIDPSARSAAMGGASIVSTDDVFAFYHSPAGLSLLWKNEAAFSYLSWFESMSGEFGVIAILLPYGITIGAGGAYFSSGDIDGMDAGGRAASACGEGCKRNRAAFPEHSSGAALRRVTLAVLTASAYSGQSGHRSG